MLKYDSYAITKWGKPKNKVFFKWPCQLKQGSRIQTLELKKQFIEEKTLFNL